MTQEDSIIYFSDGASAHFKNNLSMINLVHHEVDFGLEASWTFSATGHGKGAGDGIGAYLKSTAKRATLSQRVHLSSPRDFYQFLVKDQDETAKAAGNANPAVFVLFLPATEVEIVKQRIINPRTQKLSSTGNDCIFFLFVIHLNT